MRLNLTKATGYATERFVEHKMAKLIERTGLDLTWVLAVRPDNQVEPRAPGGGKYVPVALLRPNQMQFAVVLAGAGVFVTN